MATKLLLINDVEDLGNSGEIVNVRPGFARNYLLPQGLAVLATARTLRMQEKLQEERKQRALTDKAEAEEIAKKIQDASVTSVVKVDHEGHMYGSVSSLDVLKLVMDQLHVELEKRNIALKHPIKETGVHVISVKLKEGVTASFNLKVLSEEGHRAANEAVDANS